MGRYKNGGELIDVVIKRVARGQEDEALAEAKPLYKEVIEG